MVIQNGFGVQLYNPDTNSPYKEFHKDGHVYVEVYPDAQYFIQIGTVDQGDGWFMARRQTAMALMFVDGKPLGDRPVIMHLHGGSASSLVGYDTDEGERALQFVLPKLNVAPSRAQQRAGVSHQVHGADTMAPLYGEIVVGIFETCLAPVTAPTVAPPVSTTSSGNFSPSSVCSMNSKSFASEAATKMDVSADLKDKKVMRSTEGTATVAPSMPPTTLQYRCGPNIETFRLRYCSTVGLIVAGVLPKPSPNWTPQNAAPTGAPVVAPPSLDLSKVVSQTIRYQDVNGLAHEAIQHDLTGLSDDEDGSD